MAIGDDFTIDYVNKRITHTSGTSTYTANELYSYLQDTFDELTQMDDTVPMSAQTPTSYTLINGWFMDDVSLQYISGGAITTSGWDGVIQIITFQSGGYVNAVSGDIGKTVNDDAVDWGELLYYDNTLRKWWVRATTTMASSSAVTIDSGTGAGTVNADSLTGETLWANPYSLGAIETNTRLYIAQSDSVLSDWWSDGHIDILVKVREASTLIDSGSITVFGRQYSKEYDHFKIDLSSGGRQPIPLATGDDLNNTTGYRTLTGSSGSGTFQVDEIITGGTSGAQAIVTAVGGTGAAPVLTYYLIGDLTDFQAAETCTGGTSSATCTTGSPSDTGPATDTSITVTFGYASQDLNNGNGSQPYSITIDCNNQGLDEVYERTKYLTRRGETTTLNSLEGQQYRGSQLDLDYDGQTGNFTEGLVITGGTSGATARIVSDQDGGATGTLILSNLRGTFQNNETITDTSTGSATVNGTGRLITEVKKAPFGTFAGGIFFAAPGVWLSNVASADAKNFQLIDNEGTVQNPPNTQNITVQSVVSGDRILVAESTGSGQTDVKKDQLAISGTISSGSGTITVTTTIPSDFPSSGIVRVVRPGEGEERYTYTSYSGSVFTLSGTTSEDYNNSDGDTVYVPFLDLQATGTEEFVQIIYSSDRNLVARVRLKGILPFESTGTLSSSGYTVSAIRTSDSIVT